MTPTTPRAAGSDSTFDRALRMLRELPPEERLEAIAYGVAIHLELEGPRQLGLGLTLNKLEDRVRELQARAFG